MVQQVSPPDLWVDVSVRSDRICSPAVAVVHFTTIFENSASPEGDNTAMLRFEHIKLDLGILVNTSLFFFFLVMSDRL